MLHSDAVAIISKWTKKGRHTDFIQKKLKEKGHNYPDFIIEDEIRKSSLASHLIEQSSSKEMKLWIKLPLFIFIFIAFWLIPIPYPKLIAYPVFVVAFLTAWFRV